MTRLFPVAGSKIYIGAAKNPKGVVSAADFAAESWLEIDGWTNAGAIGDTTEVIEQNLINQSRTRKAKGTSNGGTMENQFLPDASDPGQVKFREAINDCKPYAFKIEWGANCPREGVATITIAEPGVVTLAGHGFAAGTPVVFTSTGDLPTGLTADTTYYVSDPTTDTFKVSATSGGAEITTTGTQSGVHTVTGGELGKTDFFFGLALDGAKQGGEANTIQLRSWSIAIDSNILEV